MILIIIVRVNLLDILLKNNYILVFDIRNIKFISVFIYYFLKEISNSFNNITPNF